MSRLHIPGTTKAGGGGEDKANKLLVQKIFVVTNICITTATAQMLKAAVNNLNMKHNINIDTTTTTMASTTRTTASTRQEQEHHHY